MERRPGILRRYGLALLLVGVMGYILVTTTLPAAAERDRMRALRSAQERQHQALHLEVADKQAWLHGMQHDPFLQRRMAEQRSLSPEIQGPVLVPASPANPANPAKQMEPDDGEFSLPSLKASQPVGSPPSNGR